jgi:hypothetical protein
MIVGHAFLIPGGQESVLLQRESLSEVLRQAVGEEFVVSASARLFFASQRPA